jgi:hypothetical protein
MPQGFAKLPGESLYQESDPQNTTQEYTLNIQSNQTSQFSGKNDSTNNQSIHQQQISHQVHHQPQHQQGNNPQHQSYESSMDHNPKNLMSPRASNTSIRDSMVTSHDFVVPGVPLPVPDLDKKMAASPHQ